MISRRRAFAVSWSLFAAGNGAQLASSSARAQNADWSEWLGTYSGAVRFYRSIPLQDIFPPPKTPAVDLDDRAPFGLQFSIRSVDGTATVWLRIDGGPMQSDLQGEQLSFGPLVEGVALLRSWEGRPAPRTATLTVRPRQLATEALFAHADGSFWRRHFTASFTPNGADVILWVFDAAGTRARTWRGSTVRRDP